MSRIDWSCLVFSAFTGLLLGLAVGSASHWTVGAVLFMGWMLLHRLTWGFAAIPVTSSDMQCMEMESCA
jgi:hypothetical protein